MGFWQGSVNACCVHDDVMVLLVLWYVEVHSDEPCIAAAIVSCHGRGIAAFLDLLGIGPECVVICILVLAYLHM